MSNGSEKLSLVQRLNIAVDVASALHYLHDNCETPVVHCDNNNNSISKSSTVGIKGTIGYAPPGKEMSRELSVKLPDPLLIYLLVVC
ncbi:LRR receptor-like serine/threonine-protein kinase EFR [Linum perenne]